MEGERGLSAAEERRDERVVPFRAGDGLECNVIQVRGERPATRGPVLLVHGAGVRANLFRAPVGTTIVDALLDAGYDVWLENWRASIDLPPNEWTLDQAAVHDHPTAVRTVVNETGADEVKAIIHCQGSTSFMMSAVAGLVPEVKTIVANAVSLHTIIPPVSRFKIKRLLPLIRPLTRYLDPQWGVEAPTATAKAIALMVRLTHHECDNAVCKMASFTYGTGWPTLWRHENLNEETHEWIKGEFAHVPLTFFAQMARCVGQGHLVSVEGRPELPPDFVAQAPQTDARFVFFAGGQNRCFLPESQRRTFAFFDEQRPGYHALHELPDYAHLDVFIGKDAGRDVFPLMLRELER
ncbi:MAG: alpha/beta fold hydrolase [Gaiellaceae bacterium]